MSPPPIIVALSGYAGVGKDSVADFLCKAFDCKRLAFADKVREVAARLNPYFRADELGVYKGATYNELVSEMGYDQAKRLFPCVRKYLVDIGQGLREVLGDTLWIDQVTQQIDLAIAKRSVVVTDCRYENEAETIDRMGGFVVMITRPGVGPANDTERDSIEKIQPDFVVHNDEGLVELEAAVLHVFEVARSDRAFEIRTAEARRTDNGAFEHFAR